MDYSRYGMDRALIYGATPAVERFLDEWYDGRDFIEAHTSGSTGTPKVIRLHKSDMMASALATCGFFGIGADSTMVMPLSANYIAGKMMIVRALVTGARLYVEKPSTSPLSEWNEGPVDLLPIVPSQISGFLASPAIDMVRNVIVGGAAVSSDDEIRLRSISASVYATYGMTETCSHVALRSITAAERCFRALPGISFSTDERGCLVINGSRFSFLPIVTNDVVDLLDSERFVWLGRIDNVINSGGVKIHPEEIERMIEPLMGNRNYYITARRSARWGEEAVLMVEGDVADSNLLLENIRSVVPQYSAPKAIIPVEEFGRTSSGKIKRQKLLYDD